MASGLLIYWGAKVTHVSLLSHFERKSELKGDREMSYLLRNRKRKLDE